MTTELTCRQLYVWIRDCYSAPTDTFKLRVLSAFHMLAVGQMDRPLSSLNDRLNKQPETFLHPRSPFHRQSKTALAIDRLLKDCDVDIGLEAFRRQLPMTKRKRDRFKHSLKDLLAKFGVASRNELASLLISRELRELERTGSAEPLAQAVAMQNALFGIQQKPSEPPPRA